MNSKVEMMETRIPKGRTLHMQDGQGLDLQVVSGCLWVTYEHDTEDMVVEAGDTLHVSRNGLTLVHAFQEVQLRIAYPREAGAPTLTLGGGYREFASSVAGSMVAEWLRAVSARFSAGARAMRPGGLGMTSR